jgi:hypothetical protein
LTEVVNEDDNSLSSDDSSMPPLQIHKGKQWMDPNESDEDDNTLEDSQEQDIALVADNLSDELINYLRQVAIEKGIREPNINSWASSVENKLNKN